MIFNIYIYNIYIYIYIYICIYNKSKTYMCLEYSIIMTTENIYICTGRKSSQNKDKVMNAQLKVFYFLTEFST